MKPPREARLLRSHHLPHCCRQPQHSSHPDPKGAPLALAAAAPEHLGYMSGQAAGAAFAALLSNVSATYDAAAAEIKALANATTKPIDKQRASYASQILEAALP